MIQPKQLQILESDVVWDEEEAPDPNRIQWDDGLLSGAGRAAQDYLTSRHAVSPGGPAQFMQEKLGDQFMQAREQVQDSPRARGIQENYSEEPVKTIDSPYVQMTNPIPSFIANQMTGDTSERDRVRNIQGLGVDAAAAVAGDLAITKGSVGMNALSRLSRRTPKDFLRMAQKRTTELTVPPTKALASAKKMGVVSPRVEEVTKVIRPAKSFDEVGGQIKGAATKSMESRNANIRANNYKVSGNYVDDLRGFIKEARSKGQYSDAEIGQMEDVLNREIQFIKKNKNFDRMSAQERKEYLQTLTKKLLTRREAGEDVIVEPARKQAMDVLRKSLKEKVGGGEAAVEVPNASYGGLVKGGEDVATQSAAAEKIPVEGPIKRVAQALASFIIRPTPATGAAALARGALGAEKSMLAKTTDIANLYARSQGGAAQTSSSAIMGLFKALRGSGKKLNLSANIPTKEAVKQVVKHVSKKKPPKKTGTAIKDDVLKSVKEKMLKRNEMIKNKPKPRKSSKRKYDPWKKM